MAKKSVINHNEKRRRLVKKFSNKRAKLKAIVSNKDLPMEERFKATLQLAELPRNSAKNRVRNRCAMTGRPRGYRRKFNLSRNLVRELAQVGELPGIVKSSW